MARSFTATSDHFNNSALASPGSKGTVVAWINPTWSGSSDAGDRNFWWFGQANRLQFEKYSDKNVYIGWSSTGNAARIVISASGLFVAGQWACHIFTWDSSVPNETYYVNNVSKGTFTTAFSGGVADAGFTIGNSYLFNTSSNASIAEVGWWNVVLSADEIAALSAGMLPYRIRPASLAGYWPLWGLQSPEPDLSGAGNSGTLTGTAFATHAPVTLFLPPVNSLVAATGGGVTAAAQLLSCMGCGA